MLTEVQLVYRIDGVPGSYHCASEYSSAFVVAVASEPGQSTYSTRASNVLASDRIAHLSTAEHDRGCDHVTNTLLSLMIGRRD